MKKDKYMIVVEVGKRTIFDSTSRDKDVDKWLAAYEQSPQASEIKLYKNSANGYELLWRNTRKTIGF